jgi:broad specificity phosphatase PhoE
MVERIIFIRHPQTIWQDVKDPEDQDFSKRLMGSTDIGLGKKGIRQAKSIAKYIKTIRPDKIYSSPLSRAKTASDMIKKTGLKVSITVSKELKEIDFGKCEGMTFYELEKKYPKVYRKYISRDKSMSFPSGDSLANFRMRIQKFIDKIIKNEKGTIVIITHGGVIRSALCHLLPVDDDFIWNIHLDYGSVTDLFLIGDIFVLYKLNHQISWQK